MEKTRYCDVDSCPDEACYINPESKMKYCEKHAKALGYRIIHDSSRHLQTEFVKIKKNKR
jgi:hypothetical protein